MRRNPALKCDWRSSSPEDLKKKKNSVLLLGRYRLPSHCTAAARFFELLEKQTECQVDRVKWTTESRCYGWIMHNVLEATKNVQIKSTLIAFNHFRLSSTAFDFLRIFQTF